MRYNRNMEYEELTPESIKYYLKTRSELVDKCKRLEDLIDSYYYRLSGLKAADPTRTKGNYNKSSAADFYYRMSEKIEQAEAELTYYRQSLKSIEEFGRALNIKIQ